MENFRTKRDIVDKVAKIDGFLHTLVAELNKLFLIDWKEHVLDLVGTQGVCRAFVKTCEAFELYDIIDYYNKLTWAESDNFDEILLNRVKYF